MNTKLNRRDMLKLTTTAIVGLSTLKLTEAKPMKEAFDIIIIGGGPAGLTGALTAARGNRSVLVLDHGKPRNAPAAHMMNFPSRDGTPPQEFRDLIKRDLRAYSKVQIRSKEVATIQKSDQGFMVDGVFAKKILLAHGVTDLLPNIDGMRELFGKSIFHCPYCHGYEHRNTKLAVIGPAEYALHMTPLLKGLSKDVIYFSNGELLPDLEGTKMYSEKIEAFIREGTQLKGIKLSSGEIIERDYGFSKFDQKLSMDVGIKLGCELTPLGHYKVNDFGETTVKGVFAAGDCAVMRQSVLTACSSAQLAASMMNMEILSGR